MGEGRVGEAEWWRGKWGRVSGGGESGAGKSGAGRMGGGESGEGRMEGRVGEERTPGTSNTWYIQRTYLPKTNVPVCPNPAVHTYAQIYLLKIHLLLLGPSAGQSSRPGAQVGSSPWRPAVRLYRVGMRAQLKQSRPSACTHM